MLVFVLCLVRGVAAGTLGRTLRLFGQLRRLPLFARDLRLRLAAQALLKLPLVAQLLLGGMLLMPLLMRGGVLLMPLEQLGLMLGAALVSLGALALGADAVLIGRPFVTAVYGGKEEGVQLYVQKLKAELADTMRMCGAHSLAEIKRSMLFGF